MEKICENIVYNVDVKNAYGVTSISIMENGAEMDCSFEEQYSSLIEFFGTSITDVKKFPENSGYQRKKIISFKYKGRYCEISEHFGSQRDYLCVKIENLTFKQMVMSKTIAHI